MRGFGNPDDRVTPSPLIQQTGFERGGGMKTRSPSEVRRLQQKWGCCHLMGPEHEALLMKGETLSELRKADLDALTELVFGHSLSDPPGYRERHHAADR
jgi:hypothetical protein